jgi:hypothetical protein
VLAVAEVRVALSLEMVATHLLLAGHLLRFNLPDLFLLAVGAVLLALTIQGLAQAVLVAVDTIS